jgi:hypothetical protein
MGQLELSGQWELISFVHVLHESLAIHSITHQFLCINESFEGDWELETGSENLPRQFSTLPEKGSTGVIWSFYFNLDLKASRVIKVY